MDSEPKENSDLLKARNKVETNGNLKNEDLKGPPDGGVRAYSVMVASFLTNGLFFGVINSYSVIYTVLERHLKDEGISNSESRAGKYLFAFIFLTLLVRVFHHTKRRVEFHIELAYLSVNHI